MPRPHPALAAATAPSAVLLLTATLALAPLPAAAQVVCGGVITASVTLTADLECPWDESMEPVPFLIVVGPAVLDLGGNAVSCGGGGNATASGVCIELVGRGATLRNGLVQAAESSAAAVHLAGKGRHAVVDVTVLGGYGGFVSASDRNQIVDSSATSADVAFLVLGDRNVLTDNIGKGGMAQGDFELHGARSQLERNTALWNGFRVLGPNSRLRDNHARVAPEDQCGLPCGGGFRLEAGANRTTIQGGSAIGSAFGVWIGSDRNQVTGLVVRDSRWGIVAAAGADRTDILRNDVLNSLETDLTDENPGCAKNRWRGNLFATASQGCVR